ncbi:MAG: carbamate kinase [Halobacteriales archaeon]
MPGPDADPAGDEPPEFHPDEVPEFELDVEPPAFWGTPREKPLTIIALGGNAISPGDDAGTYEAQLAEVEATAKQVVEVMKAGYKVVLTHGNGPQVGALLEQQEQGTPPAQPLSVCGAMSQGQIGYMLAQRMQAQLERRWKHVPVACILTQTIVAADDPAFDDPTKPIGPYLTDSRAEELRAAGATVKRVREADERPYRRVVPSPEPLGIVEEVPVKRLIDQRDLVICGGGGGVPVTRSEGTIEGHDAVVDKDLLSARLAQTLNADYLLMLTDVDAVYRDYGTDDEAPIDEIAAPELRELHEQGQFPAGSMGPKVEAACRFVDGQSRRDRTAIVAALDDAKAALEHEAGTRVVRRA